MKRFLVVANPRGGTCKQLVTAETEDEAIIKAKENPNGWIHATPQDRDKDWNYRAYERNSSVNNRGRA